MINCYTKHESFLFKSRPITFKISLLILLHKSSRYILRTFVNDLLLYQARIIPFLNLSRHVWNFVLSVSFLLLHNSLLYTLRKFVNDPLLCQVSIISFLYVISRLKLYTIPFISIITQIFE